MASDSIDWCRKNIRCPGVKVVSSAAAVKDHYLGRRLLRRDLLDMMLLAACDHVIYDYGTYGFWTSYLTRGHSFFPRNMLVSW